jgi:hypothetical protein
MPKMLQFFCYRKNIIGFITAPTGLAIKDPVIRHSDAKKCLLVVKQARIRGQENEIAFLREIILE